MSVEGFEAWATKSNVSIRGLGCTICLLPADLLAQVNRAWVELGARETALRRYITEQGQQAPGNGAFNNHFRVGRHHERDV